MTETSGLQLVFTKATPGITCRWNDPDDPGEDDCGSPAVQVASYVAGGEEGLILAFCDRHMHIAGLLSRQYQSRHN